MITLEANYSKKIGLPGYSSHQFSISLKTELPDTTKVQEESARLYRLLQDGVDHSIQEVGFLPGQGSENGHAQTRSNGHGSRNGNGNGHTNGNGHGQTDKDAWNCSDKQRNLIIKVVDEHKLDKVKLESLAQERFGKGVRQLNKLEASGFIEELFEMTGQPKTQGRNRFQKAGGR
jgi:hypothetical protein